MKRTTALTIFDFLCLVVVVVGLVALVYYSLTQAENALIRHG